MLSDRVIGIGFVIAGVAFAVPGIAEIASGHLITSGGGKHPWTRGFFLFFFGSHAHIASGYLTLCVSSGLIVLGARLILRKPKAQTKEAE